MKLPNNRTIFFIITFFCAISLAYAYYAQYYQNLEPCPLCIAQRLIIAVILLLSLLYGIHNPKTVLSKVYSLVLISFAAFGIKTAAHHQWLMNLPPEQQPLSCGMPLDVLFRRVPLDSFLHTVLQGDAECGKVTWIIFGITPPIAVILLCGFVILLSLVILLRKKPQLSL